MLLFSFRGINRSGYPPAIQLLLVFLFILHDGDPADVSCPPFLIPLFLCLCLKQSIGLFARPKTERKASPWESSERNRQFVSRFGIQRSRRDENSKNAKKLFPPTGQGNGFGWGGRQQEREWDWLTILSSITIEEWICWNIISEMVEFYFWMDDSMLFNGNLLQFRQFP